MLTRAEVNDNVKSSLGFPFTNSCFFIVHLTLETMTESQFCVSVGCDGFCKSVSGRIDSSASVPLSPALFLFSLSFLPYFSLPPSFCLSLSFRFSSSFLLQVVKPRSSVDAFRKNHPFQPSPCVFYVHEISQEFAYVQITSRWFEISHRQICLRQPSLFRRSALQARFFWKPLYLSESSHFFFKFQTLQESLHRIIFSDHFLFQKTTSFHVGFSRLD